MKRIRSAMAKGTTEWSYANAVSAGPVAEALVGGQMGDLRIKGTKGDGE